MELLIAAALTLTGSPTGSAETAVHPAPRILGAPYALKAIPEVWALPDNQSDTVVLSASTWG